MGSPTNKGMSPRIRNQISKSSFGTGTEYMETERNLLTENTSRLDSSHFCSDSDENFSDYRSVTSKRKSNPKKSGEIKKSNFHEKKGRPLKKSDTVIVQKTKKIIEEKEQEALELEIQNNQRVIDESKKLVFKVSCFDYLRLFLPDFLDSYTKKDVFMEVSSKSSKLLIFFIGQGNDQIENGNFNSHQIFE
jgi:hypothetical protein